jgi:hypothetical protein
VSLFATIASLTGVLTAGIIYGTDVFCALVQRPALARLDDATMAAVMGRLHEYGEPAAAGPGFHRHPRRRHCRSGPGRQRVAGRRDRSGHRPDLDAYLAGLYLRGRPDQPGAHRPSRRARDAGQCPGPAVPLGQHHHGPCGADGGRLSWPCLQHRRALTPRCGIRELTAAFRKDEQDLCPDAGRRGSIRSLVEGRLAPGSMPGAIRCKRTLPSIRSRTSQPDACPTVKCARPAPGCM